MELGSNNAEVFDSRVPGDGALLETELDGTGYEDEVVLDSEDEESKPSSVHRGAIELEGKLVSRGRDFCSIVRRAVGERKSLVNCPSSKDRSGQRRLLPCDWNFDNLNYTCSEYPGESSQAQALEFVDQFVLYNDENLYQRDEFSKGSKRRSPLISRAKGTCILAQRLGIQTLNVGTFQWDDSKQLVEEIVPCKNVEASLTDNHKARLLESEICSNELEDKKDRMELTMEENEYNTESGKVLDAKQLFEGPDDEEDTPNMCDIGVNTQIAAEAMEALFYGIPTSCNEKDVYKDQLKTCNSLPRSEASNALYLENSIPRKSFDSDVECIAGKSKQGKQIAQKVYQRKLRNQSKRQKLDSKLTIAEEVKRDSLLSGKQTTFENPACTDEVSDRLSHMPVQRKVNRHMSRTNIDKLLPRTEIQNDCTNSSLVDLRARHGVLADELGKILRKTAYVTEGGITTYRRKRSPRNRELLQNMKTKRKVAGISTYSDPWNFPRRKRSCWKIVDNSNNVGDLQSTIREILGYERKNQSVKSLKSADGMPMFSNWNRNRVSQSSKDVCLVQHSSEDKPHLTQDRDKQGSASAIIHFELAVGYDTAHSTNKDLAKPDNLSENSRVIDCISCAGDARQSVCITVSSKRKAKLSGARSAKNFEAPDNNCHESDRKPYTKNLPKTSMLKELIKLGVPESIPGSTWKDLRKRRDMTCIRVLFSQHLDDCMLKQQKKFAARLGISITVCSKDSTHFVADNFIRTRNMLEAIAAGKPVVTHLWLESCGQAGYLIDEKNFILRDVRKEKEIGFSMPVSLSRASNQPLLKGFRLLITPRIKPDEDTIASLITVIHGQTVERSEISAGSDERFPDDLLILSCEEDYAICKPFLYKGAKIYSSELLLNGIIIQKLEFERHQLFKNHVEKSSRSRWPKKYANSCKI